MKGERSQQLPSSSFLAFGAFCGYRGDMTDALLGLGSGPALGKKLGSELPNSQYTNQGAHTGTDGSMGDLAPPAGGF